jgi:hypothetical protein
LCVAELKDQRALPIVLLVLVVDQTQLLSNVLRINTFSVGTLKARDCKDAQVARASWMHSLQFSGKRIVVVGMQRC